jgi:hypothetical protein
MWAALLIAALSFFLGQQQVFPPSVRGSPLLFVPKIAVVGVMIFWVVRVRFTNRFKAIAIVPRASAGTRLITILNPHKDHSTG